MFANYFKTALRNIIRHKGYTFINIAGLAIGMACCIFILLWVNDELSFDKFHSKAHRIYRIAEEVEYNDTDRTRYPIIGPGIAPAVKNDNLDAVEEMTRLFFVSAVLEHLRTVFAFLWTFLHYR